MKFLGKRTSSLVEASLILLLLAHIATSCKTKVEAFKFKDHEKADSIEASAVAEKQNGNIQLKEILPGTFFQDKEETEHKEVERRDEKAITQTSKINFKESNQDVTRNQQNNRNIFPPSNIGMYHELCE